MEKWAIEVNDLVMTMNEMELANLDDNGISYKTIGLVCDNDEFGDRCNKDCQHFCCGTCPATPIRDFIGNLWHILKEN